MQFGSVFSEQLAIIDFSLPPDPELTTQTLSQSRPTQPLQVYVGCSSWGRKEWKGNLFPARLKEADFLSEYVKHFNCVELNATFYRIFEAATIAKWKEKAESNPNFHFCPKFSQIISHMRCLKNVDDITTVFFDSILAFEDKLGPAFLQLSDNFGPRNFTDLKYYLESLPHDIPLFTELRHRDWFVQPTVREAAFSLLHQQNTGAIITDTAGRRDCVHMYLTVPHTFIRFVGNNLHPTDYTRIDAWINRIKQWTLQGLQSVHFIIHQHDERNAPELCDYFIQGISKELNLAISRPRIIRQTGTLF